jgi:hypothetical protein
MRRLTAILVAFVLGCASVPQLQRVERPEPASNRWTILAPDLAPHIPEWDRRFAEALGHNNFHILAAHGGEHNGGWWLGVGTQMDARPSMPVRLMVRAIRQQIGDGPYIIILSCNPGGIVLSEPKILQATTIIWAKPGDDVRRLPDGSTRHLAGDVDDFYVTQ